MNKETDTQGLSSRPMGEGVRVKVTPELVELVAVTICDRYDTLGFSETAKIVCELVAEELSAAPSGQQEASVEKIVGELERVADKAKYRHSEAASLMLQAAALLRRERERSE